MLVNRLGVPFLVGLPIAFVVVGADRRRARAHALRPRLRQAAISTRCCSPSAWCSCRSPASTTSWARRSSSCSSRRRCRASSTSFGIGIGRYRLLIIVVCGLLTVALQLILAQDAVRQPAARGGRRPARGARASASMSARVFGVTFAFGSGLAALGGALGAEILGLDPTFPLKYMIYFLIVVTVGGTSSITGPFVASILLGIGDVAGKYYVPKLGAFVIYTIMIVVLIWRPQGLFVARDAGDVA